MAFDKLYNNLLTYNFFNISYSVINNNVDKGFIEFFDLLDLLVTLIKYRLY